jgi:hypothetical protein
MVLKKLNVALADHSGRAEDADWVFCFHGHEHSSVQEDGRPQRLRSAIPLQLSGLEPLAARRRDCFRTFGAATGSNANTTVEDGLSGGSRRLQPSENGPKYKGL